jgi:hypothetical protein
MRSWVALLVVLLLPGTASAFWPAYWELGGQKNFLGPLFSYERDKEGSHVAVRPLLSSYDSPGNYSIIFPLGKSTPEKSYFFPVYMRHRALDASDTAIFPFFWGRTSDGRSYGGVFPFYGKLYKRFRRDEIDFALWPLYASSTWEGTTRRSVIWPLFSVYSGRQEGFKIGPLYGAGNGARTGSPCSSSGPSSSGTRRASPRTTREKPMGLPLLHADHRSKVSYRAVLWPFFTYMETPYKTELKAPWPIYSRTTGKEESGVSAWPFYSHYMDGKDKVTYVAWPVYKRVERHPGERTFIMERVLLIDKYERDDRGTFLNIWPFFEYRRSPERTSFFFPSVVPCVTGSSTPS